MQRAFAPLPGGGVAAYNSSGLLYYGHSDHLGSVRLASSPSAGGVVNPGFETGDTTGWVPGFWGTNVFVSSTQAQSGTYSLAQNGVTGGSYQDVPGLISGQSYQVSVWVLADSGSTAQTMLEVHDTNGGNLVQSSQFTPGTSWQQVTVTFVADSTNTMRIVLWYYSGSGTIYYDSVSVSPSIGGMYFDLAFAPFGETYAASGSTDPSFTGQRQDTVSGLYDFPAREYSFTGRWVSPDPAGLKAVSLSNPQTWNRYSYVANTPTSFKDPLGLTRYYLQCPPPGHGGRCVSASGGSDCADLTCQYAGNDIFDAIAGAPGTYISYNMYGQLSFGFSIDLWMATENFIDAANTRTTFWKTGPVATTGYEVIAHDYGANSTTSGFIPELLSATAQGSSDAGPPPRPPVDLQEALAFRGWAAKDLCDSGQCDPMLAYQLMLALHPDVNDYRNALWSWLQIFSDPIVPVFVNYQGLFH